ncbi:MAG TPA: PQQ-binding-like beta-propeller repeat protein [Planctomycetaceae bacterium]|jgi:outer membrane protein assembly factor BamB|nr:PQQ-binding-like beta-propeller repeat protein [Planctomycetaceae bacterium]
MTAAPSVDSCDPKPARERKPLRLWPGVVIVVLQSLAWLALPRLFPEAAFYGIVVGIFGGGLAVVSWWLFLSRAPWVERVGALALMVVGLFAVSFIIHKSIANGMMGMMLPVLGIPILCLALVLWAVASSRLSPRIRRATLVVTILIAFGMFTLLRTGGISGDGQSDLHWRWTPTPEERLLESNEAALLPALTAPSTGVATTTVAKKPSADKDAQKSVANWPGFRGIERDGIVRAVRIATDWSRSPPVQLWRRPIGPGWSSFAVRGELLYTQEQRGEDEVVGCYRVTTGQPVWRHSDAARFWESNAGAGPRATPTLAGDRVYTCGATGIVNALDAGDGALVWSRNAATDTGVKVPQWGFAGSPLVVDDLVIVATGGRLIAYDRATGRLLWLGPDGGGGYSSPQLATIGGVEQVLLLNGVGAISVAPATGTQLWKYGWDSDGIVQPGFTADGDLLIGSGSGMSGGVGVRRILVAHESSGWTTEERWTSVGLKPYFNDFVVHAGHAYGFDNGFLACIDLADGKRKWKGGRYGHGQLILLLEQDLLLVLSEHGGLALVAAQPEQFREMAKVPAIEGKTWNHPVLAGDVLLTRNAEEMVAFRLSLADR